VNGSLKEVFATLAILKKTEEKILRLKEGLKEIPEEIEKAKSLLKSKAEKINELQHLHEAKKKQLRTAELDLKEKEATLEHAEAKLMQVRTNEEYQAALKENTIQKEQLSKLEDEVLNCLMDVEKLQEELNNEKKTYASSEATFNEDKKRLEAESQKLESLLGAENKAKKEFLDKLPKEVINIYYRIASSRFINPVTFVDNGMCQSCRIRLRPQLYNEIIGYQKIHTCSNCGRILVPSISEDSQDEE